MLRHNLVFKALPLASNLTTSLTNFAVTACLMATGGPNALGIFTLLVAPWAVGTTMLRALGIQVMLAEGSTVRTLRTVYVTIAVTAMTVSLMVLVANPATRPYWFVSLIIPIALLQDLLRFEAFAAMETSRALTSDLVWLGTLAATIGAIAVSAKDLTARDVVLAWSLGALVSFVCMLLLRKASRFQHEQPDMPRRNVVLLVDSIAVMAAGQALLYGFAFLEGTQQVGEFRFIQTMLMPAALLSSSALAFALPRMPRMAHTALAQVTRSYIVALPSLAAGLMVLVALVVLRSEMFSTFQATIDTTFVLAYLIGLMALYLALPNQFALTLVRARIPWRKWLPIRILSAMAEPAIGLGLARILGVVGAAIGLAAHQVILGWSLARLLRAMRRVESQRSLDTPSKVGDHSLD